MSCLCALPAVPRNRPFQPIALLRSTNLDYLGLGPIVSYDARDLIAAGTLVLEANTSNDIPRKAYFVTEDLMTAYLQFDIERELGAGSLTGNVGVQAVHTNQKSTGVAFANIDGIDGDERIPISLGADFWDVLPSLNLSLRLDSDWIFRLAASRQIQRPQLDDLRIAIGYGININEAESPTGLAPFISGGGGNPLLRPYRANAVDFNVEKYFANGSGVIAVQLFYKNIVSYIDGSRTVFDYTAFPDPAGATPVTQIGFLDSRLTLAAVISMGSNYRPRFHSRYLLKHSMDLV